MLFIDANVIEKQMMDMIMTMINYVKTDESNDILATKEQINKTSFRNHNSRGSKNNNKRK
jgi:hypothetical protein